MKTLLLLEVYFYDITAVLLEYMAFTSFTAVLLLLSKLSEYFCHYCKQTFFAKGQMNSLTITVVF